MNGDDSSKKKRGGIRYLAKNVGLLTASNFASKILVFFLVPLYTSVLSTSDYGTYDLYNTTVSLLIPIMTANIADAVLRFSLEEEADYSAVLHVGLHYALLGFGGVCLGTVSLLAFGLGETLAQWWPMFLLMYFIHSVLSVVSNFARGIDCVREVAIGGVIASATLVGLNILFLLPMHMGLAGYFLATILSMTAQLTYLTIALRLWQYLHLEKMNTVLAASMRAYGIPLTANSVAWWVNSASDRYIVTAFCGVAQNGIYAVAGKIPQILNVMQTIFTQAWVLSAVKDVDSQDDGGFFRKTYNAYGCFMVLVCSMLIAFDKVIARLMYAADFYEAWRYAPPLLVAILFGALSGHLGGAFAAAKDSRAYARTTVIGAIANVLVNFALVPTLGAMGAAMSTCLSYWIVWFMRRRLVVRYVDVTFNLARDYASYIVLIAQCALLILVESLPVLVNGLELCAFLVQLVLYREELAMWRELAGRAFRAVRKKSILGKRGSN